MKQETRYAKSGDISIAYQVIGSGERDLMYVPGFFSNVEVMWEHPPLAHFLGRLSSFARLIVFDKRGTGLSDRVPLDRLPTIEQRMDDVRAVLDAAGSKHATLFGHAEGGPMCMVFAATHPLRTTSLILYGTYAKRIRDGDYPWAPTREDAEHGVELAATQWASPTYVQYFAETLAPSAVADPDFCHWLGSYMRQSASPAAAAALVRMNREIDVRAVLGTLRVPALIMCRSGDRSGRIDGARYIAARIPGARLMELPGDDNLFWVGDVDAVIDGIEEFLTGSRPAPEADRFLATVLFTDIVSGTAKAARIGDRRWGELVEAHHRLVRAELLRYRGNEVDTAGDGFFATFDGPARAVRCALAVRDGVRRLGLEIRAGVHTGECQMIAGKVGGIAAIIGARVRERAAPGEVLSSSTVKDLVAGSGLKFEDRGRHPLKGVPGEWQLFSAT